MKNRYFKLLSTLLILFPLLMSNSPAPSSYKNIVFNYKDFTIDNFILNENSVDITFTNTGDYVITNMEEYSYTCLCFKMNDDSIIDIYNRNTPYFIYPNETKEVSFDISNSYIDSSFNYKDAKDIYFNYAYTFYYLSPKTFILDKGNYDENNDLTTFTLKYSFNELVYLKAIVFKIDDLVFSKEIDGDDRHASKNVEFTTTLSIKGNKLKENQSVEILFINDTYETNYSSKGIGYIFLALFFLCAFIFVPLAIISGIIVLIIILIKRKKKSN